MHVVHTPRYSGAEMLVLALTRLHQKMGHQSMVASMFPSENDFQVMIEEQRQLGIDWISPGQVTGRVGRLRSLRAAGCAFKPDVVFAHSVLPAAYARLAGLKNVISVLHAEQDYTERSIRYIEKALQYRSAGVISVSPLSTMHYKKCFTYPKVVCIPNGVNLSEFSKEYPDARAAVRDEFGLSDESIVILQVGRINEIKQQYLSVRAAAPLVRANKNIHFLLAGIFEDKNAIEHLKLEIKNNSITANVHLLGPRDDVPKLLHAADVYLMPSKREAHSIAMIEAMCTGIPIVASRISALEYTEVFDGIELIYPEDTLAYSSAIDRALGSGQCHMRNMSQCDINITADRYVRFAESVIC